MPNWDSTTRRSFLKHGGIAALAAAVESPLLASGPVDQLALPENKHIRSYDTNGAKRLVEQVNPLQGTNSTPLFSRGNTLPIVALPFGMAHWTLQSSDEGPWFFQPQDERLQGIRCTHQLSPWIDDYGNAAFLPFSGEPSLEPAARASSYRPEELQIAPHYLKVRLTRYRCFIELVPTERCASMRFNFQDSGPAGFLIDLPGEDAEAHCDKTNGEIFAFTRANKGGVPARFATYYVARTNATIKSFEVKELKGRRVAVVRFAAQRDKPITLHVGTSFISSSQATRNLSLEIGGRTLDQLKENSADVWEHALGRVQIQGGTAAQQKIFYSALYRASLFPRIWHEPDASGNFIHYSPYNGLVLPGVMYADHGFWDDYRAWYPMMTLIYPERLGEILQAWVNAYKEGGWFPQFPCPGYRACMTGSLIDSVFGDAAAKKLTGFDLETAYAGLKKHATQKGDPAAGYGRRGVEDYMAYGYVPSDRFAGGAVETLDSAYGDFCIAQVARAVGRRDDATAFEKRSRNWQNLFDPKTHFLRGKLSNGSWLEPFEPHTWGEAYVEGSAWQYRFSVPHDPEGLIEQMGGTATFVSYLEEMLRQAPRFNVGSYGQEIHEMSEMASVNFGQYAHSNQPVHHVLYMLTMAGRRDRTQYWVHRVLNELYTSDNFPGDEDTGSMSAWYVLSSLGIFSLCPGKPEWVFGAPLFEGASLRFPDGREIQIEARKRSRSNGFYNQIELNGTLHHGPSVEHSMLAGGAHLVFSAV